MQIPNLRIIDKQFNLLAVLDTYTSFQGERSLWEIGKLELHIGLKDQGAEALEVGNLVLIDEKRVWEITGVKKTEDDDLNLMVSGHELKGIFKQRVVIPDQKDDSHFFGWDRFPDQGDAPAEAIMRHYVEKHAVNPSDPNRAFPALIMAPYLGRGMSAVWSERFKRLDETLRDIGEYTGMGYTVTVDLASERFVFDVIRLNLIRLNLIRPNQIRPSQIQLSLSRLSPSRPSLSRPSPSRLSPSRRSSFRIQKHRSLAESHGHS
jgi:hypothetical protein